MANQTTLLTAALNHAARGWRIFPLWPGTKTPAVPEAWQQRATCDPDQVGRWWSGRPFNIGVAVGPSGLLVIDLDTPKSGRSVAGSRSGGRSATTATTATAQVSTPVSCRGHAASSATTATKITATGHGRDVFAALCAGQGQPIPADTLIVATPSGGWHLYYRHPEQGPPLRNTKGGTARALGELVDTRGHGGYVVAAGSIIGGRRYTVVRDLDPAPLPGWLTALLRDLDTAGPTATTAPPVRVSLAVTDRRSAYLRAALAREADHVRRAAKDRGNAVLWGAAVALGQLVAGGELDAALVTEVLEQAACEGGRRTPAEAQATIRSGLRRGAQRPRTVTPRTVAS